MSSLHVLFRVGAAEYALPASHVLHMESFGGATPVPGAPRHVAGLVQIRQRVVPVVDLRVRFGIETSEPPAAPRVVVVDAGGRTVGLLVDSAREVGNIPSDQIRDPPEVVSRQASGFVRSVAQFKNRMILLIDLERVIGDQESLDGDTHQA